MSWDTNELDKPYSDFIPSQLYSDRTLEINIDDLYNLPFLNSNLLDTNQNNSSALRIREAAEKSVALLEAELDLCSKNSNEICVKIEMISKYRDLYFNKRSELNSEIFRLMRQGKRQDIISIDAKIERIRNILNILSNNCEYQLNLSTRNKNGRLSPDAISKYIVCESTTYIHLAEIVQNEINLAKEL